MRDHYRPNKGYTIIRKSLRAGLHSVARVVVSDPSVYVLLRVIDPAQPRREPPKAKGRGKRGPKPRPIQDPDDLVVAEASGRGVAELLFWPTPAGHVSKMDRAGMQGGLVIEAIIDLERNHKVDARWKSRVPYSVANKPKPPPKAKAPKPDPAKEEAKPASSYSDSDSDSSSDSDSDDRAKSPAKPSSGKGPFAKSGSPFARKGSKPKASGMWAKLKGAVKDKDSDFLMNRLRSKGIVENDDDGPAKEGPAAAKSMASVVLEVKAKLPVRVPGQLDYRFDVFSTSKVVLEEDRTQMQRLARQSTLIPWDEGKEHRDATKQNKLVARVRRPRRIPPPPPPSAPAPPQLRPGSARRRRHRRLPPPACRRRRPRHVRRRAHAPPPPRPARVQARYARDKFLRTMKRAASKGASGKDSGVLPGLNPITGKSKSRYLVHDSVQVVETARWRAR